MNFKNFKIVRKLKDLPQISEYFESTTVKINDEEVAGYYNEKLNYTLVGLKDSEGVVNYYIKNNDTYKLYKEYTFNGITLNPTAKKVTGEVKKSSFTYADDKIPAYQNVKLDIIKKEEKDESKRNKNNFKFI